MAGVRVRTENIDALVGATVEGYRARSSHRGLGASSQQRIPSSDLRHGPARRLSLAIQRSEHEAENRRFAIRYPDRKIKGA